MCTEEMVFKKKYDDTVCKKIVNLRKKWNCTVKEISEVTGVSVATVKRMCKKDAERNARQSFAVILHNTRKRGRPRSITVRDERMLINKLKQLRNEDNGGNFTLKDVRHAAGLSHIPLHTVRRALLRHGYAFRVARRKGMLLEKDLRARIKFGKSIKRNYESDVWSKDVCFYLDAKSFKYKRNPLASVKCTRSRVWRKKNEGLMKGCTAKASKCGTGTKKLDVMVCISHGKGVCLVEKFNKMNGSYFTSFVGRQFPKLFAENQKRGRKLWIQDNCPSQNCKSARLAWETEGAELLKIPARSPDLNPIENVFHLAARAIDKETVEQCITKESYEDFCSRVIRTLYNIPVEVIDKTIESVDKRISLILANKGTRLKY